MKGTLVTLGCLGLLLAQAAAMALNGWALSIMWGWFIVPTFGLPALGIVPALGVAMIVSFLTTKYERGKKDEAKETATGAIAFSILYPLVMLGIGYILHLFMPA